MFAFSHQWRKKILIKSIGITLRARKAANFLSVIAHETVLQVYSDICNFITAMALRYLMLTLTAELVLHVVIITHKSWGYWTNVSQFYVKNFILMSTASALQSRNFTRSKPCFI